MKILNPYNSLVVITVSSLVSNPAVNLIASFIYLLVLVSDFVLAGKFIPCFVGICSIFVFI